MKLHWAAAATKFILLALVLKLVLVLLLLPLLLRRTSRGLASALMPAPPLSR